MFLYSVAFVLLHGAALLLIHCVTLLKEAFLVQSISAGKEIQSAAHLLIHSIALLLVFSPASRRRSRSVSRGRRLPSSTVVLALCTPRDPLVEAEAAEETSVLGLEGEGLRLGAEEAQRGTDQLQL